MFTYTNLLLARLIAFFLFTGLFAIAGAIVARWRERKTRRADRLDLHQHLEQAAA